MSQPVLIKAYGAFSGVSEKMRMKMQETFSQAIGAGDGENSILFSDGWLSISFEGIWFPVDEIREFLENCQDSGIDGKLDILDIENWRMTRLQFEDGKLKASSVPLNNVLDYSGF